MLSQCQRPDTSKQTSPHDHYTDSRGTVPRLIQTLAMPSPLLSARFRTSGAILLLTLPLSLGWHPTPTLGSLAEASSVLCFASLLALAPAPSALAMRRLLMGSGGILFLLLLRGLLQPALSTPAYAGFWVGPSVVLTAALLVSIYMQGDDEHWLRIIAAAVLVTALINALVGFMQFWRLSAFFDMLGPLLVYWDRTDNIAHGNVAQRNILASICLLGITASFYLTPKRSARTIVIEGFLAYVVALTASRTPIAILLMFVLLVLFRERRWDALGRPATRWFLATVVIALVLAPPLNALLFKLFGLIPMESSVERLSAAGLGTRPIYYQLAAEIGMQSWAWGLGWKSLPAAMVAQGYSKQVWGFDELPTNAHNILLQLWVENGLFISLLVSFYPIWLLLRKGMQNPKEDFARLSLVVLIVHSWLEFPLWHPALLLLFVALMCVLESGDQATRLLGMAPRAVLRGMLAFLAALALVTAWQFVAVAHRWEHLSKGRMDLAATGIEQLRMNPVIEPYADWLELNLGRDTPAQRAARLERLAAWLPDSMMLGLLADAYRRLGRTADARQIEQQRQVVFGVPPNGSDNP